MRKRSGTKDGAKKPPEAGFLVVTHHDLFGETAVADAKWLRFVGQRGFIVVSHDESQTRRRDEIEALMSGGVCAFCVVGKARVKLYRTMSQMVKARR